MALEHQAAQAQQRRSVEAAVVHPVLEALEDRQGQQAGQPAEPVTLELGLDEAAHHAGQALRGLEHHVADKAVADDDVGRALEDVVALDIAVEVQLPGGTRGPQQLAGPFDGLAALDGFFADVEQADARFLDAIDRRHQRTAHHRELQQVLGRRVDVGAEVEHGGEATSRIRHHRRNRGAVDTVQRLEQDLGHRHQRTGVARRHAGMGQRRLAVPAGPELLDCDAHRRVTLAPQGDLDRVVHRDHLAGRDHTAARQGRRRRQCLGLADEHQLGARVLVEEGAAGRQRHRRAVVAAHAVDGETDGIGQCRQGRVGHRDVGPDRCSSEKTKPGPARDAGRVGRFIGMHRASAAQQAQAASALLFSTLRPR
mmetsp:Transcript_1251/g.3581  ORF Transcript_1251/g.3581 Transcript_1251/m.3581 type:complete len:368 (-) Transcript_1251:709-1812(-)